MKIEMRTRGFSLTPGLRLHAERRLEFALDRHRERIARVRVVLADVNGPRKGDDKLCRVEVHLRGARPIRAAAVDGDAYAAISLAARRAGRALARSLRREQTTLVELLWLAEAISTARA